jgi:chemotaxis-related protein WspB
MLMLLFNLADGQYAVPVSEVIEVTPRVNLEQIARAPDYIAGLFNYRGQHVPVVDLCQLIHQHSCTDSFTTRIILVNFPLATGKTHMLGVLAERVTDTVRVTDDAFTPTGLSMDDTPCLGIAANTDQGLLQKITISELLPASVQAQLFPEEAV